MKIEEEISYLYVDYNIMISVGGDVFFYYYFGLKKNTLKQNNIKRLMIRFLN